jgi:hypothetical protein
MTKAELIEALQDFDDTQRVYVKLPNCQISFMAVGGVDIGECKDTQFIALTVD